MEDPLSLVRQCVLSKVAIEHSGGHFVLMGRKFPEKTESSFKRSLGQGTFYYTLHDIIFYLNNSDKATAEYRKLVIDARLTAIVEQDKLDLKDYLQGKKATCSQIDAEKAKATGAGLVASSAATPAAKSAAAPSSSSASTAASSRKDKDAMDVQDQRPADDSARPSKSSSSSSTAKAARSGETAEERASRKRKDHPPATDVAISAGEVDVTALASDRQTLKELRKHDTCSQDGFSVLRARGKDDNFQFVLKLFNDHVLKPKNAGATKQRTTTTNTNGIIIKDGEAKRIKPILIVPSALTSIITCFNCLEFLGGSYVPSEEKRKSGMQRQTEQVFTRTLPTGRKIEYRVLDNPLSLADHEWENIAAVFVTGQTWQFKDWNGKRWSAPSELFSQTLGVHLMMDDRQIDPTIKSWNCRVLKLNQSKRHLDLGASNDFWKALDAFVKLHKSQLHKE